MDKAKDDRFSLDFIRVGTEQWIDSSCLHDKRYSSRGRGGGVYGDERQDDRKGSNYLYERLLAQSSHGAGRRVAAAGKVIGDNVVATPGSGAGSQTARRWGSLLRDECVQRRAGVCRWAME